jgi:hypothetical protein
MARRIAFDWARMVTSFSIAFCINRIRLHSSLRASAKLTWRHDTSAKKDNARWMLFVGH